MVWNNYSNGMVFALLKDRPAGKVFLARINVISAVLRQNSILSAFRSCGNRRFPGEIYGASCKRATAAERVLHRLWQNCELDNEGFLMIAT